jgi:proline iminopeptidase
MRIEVNGIRLFFDVEGAKLVPDGPVMREKPTLLLLHGGPGMDHAHYKPAFSRFAGVAQVIYLDHRGNGRSARAGVSTWNLAQWGDDVRVFCDALQIEKPIVLGTSFGGLVAMSYATRHPDHPGKLILASTEARAVTERVLAAFERLGGPEAHAIADRFLAHGDSHALNDYARVCLPLYTRRVPMDREALARCLANPDVLLHYFKMPGGESSTVDFLGDLARVQCPTLVLAGEDDPITPIQSAEDIAAALPPHLVRFERFPNTGHTVFDDEPRAYDVIRAFILS